MRKTAICAAALLVLMSCNNKGNEGCYGVSDITIENGVLSPEALLSFGRLSDPQMSPDGSRIMYGVSYTSVKDNGSCRNLFLCNADGSGKVQLTRYAKSVNAARWSLDGSSIYFLQDGQLWNAALKGNRLGRKIKLSDVPAGISDYSIAPDGRHILYVSSIPGPVKSPVDFDPALDKARAYVCDGLMYRHWDHWVTETPRSYVAELGGAVITPENSRDILDGGSPLFELPTEPFGGAEQLAWSPDSRRIAYSCRKKTGIEYAFSTCTNIYVYDIESGETKAVTEKGGYDTDPAWSPDGSKLAWISMARDGYEADRQRLMVCSADDFRNVRELTEGYGYDAEGLVWAEDSKSIYFPSTIDALTAICKVDIDGGLARLTPSDWWLGFSAPFYIRQNSGVTELYATYQSMEFPSEIVRVEIPSDGKASYCQISNENGHILSQLDSIRMESVILKTAQGEDLHCWVLYPPHFDAQVKWPAVEMFNGGPQTALDQSWSYRWNFRMMCQQGYVVILPNRHGNSGMGQAWKEQISGDYQGLNMQDYMLAGRWAKEQPWCGKLAGVGASYGGFSVYNMMGIHGDLYDCFIAHAGIFNERQMWYTTEEAWFGNWDNGGLTEYAYSEGETGPRGDGVTFGGMQQAGAPYADVSKSKFHYANDPESKVCNWHTPILCIHGMMDFRIPYEQGMAAFNAAQMMGVPSRLVIFPEENHWILQPQNALFWHREFFAWLDKWLNV